MTFILTLLYVYCLMVQLDKWRDSKSIENNDDEARQEKHLT